MAVQCVFYSIKMGGVTSNERALDIFNQKPRIMEYCKSRKDCPNGGIIENDGHFHSGAGGPVPLECYRAWLSEIADIVSQEDADGSD